MSVWDKWIDRVYSETDISRSIATSVAGITGLAIYLFSKDIAIAGFSAIIVFPIIKVLCSSIHEKAENLAKIKLEKNGLQKLYSRLSPEERAVVSVFVQAGGSIMTWGQINQTDTQFSAIESLTNRGLLQTSMSVDGMRETFVLDQDLFDTGQENEQPPF